MMQGYAERQAKGKHGGLMKVNGQQTTLYNHTKTIFSYILIIKKSKKCVWSA
jgi:hypothetical protein